MTATIVDMCCEFHGADCSPYVELCCDQCPKSGPPDLDDGLDDDELAPAEPVDLDQADDFDQADDDQAEKPKAKNFYPTVYHFVQGFLIHAYADEIKEQRTELRWCPKWFHHADAFMRLEAAWKAWEKLRTDPGTGASTWFIHHGGPIMAEITRPEGPFAHCSPATPREPAKHKTKPPLPLDEPPAFLLAVYDPKRPMS